MARLFRHRPPRLLWRMLLGELLRTLAVTGVALTVAISFAGAVKPLADGQISLLDALRLAGLLSVPMLQFALPFAAGFAATLTFHRFGSDQESTGAFASGIGHRSVLLPAVVVGLVLGFGLIVLSDQVMPRFLRKAESLVQRDITRLLVSPIQRGRSISLDDLEIHADEAIGPLTPPEGSPAFQHVVLRGVLAVRPGEDGGSEWFSAQRMDLWLVENPRDPGSVGVKLVFQGASTSAPDATVRGERFETRIIPLPSRIEDDVKYLSFAEMREVRGSTRLMEQVDRRARLLAHALRERRTIARLEESIAGRGRVIFERGAEVLVLEGSELTAVGDGRWRVEHGAGGTRLALSTRLADGRERLQTARSAVLRFAESGFGDGLVSNTMTLTLEGVSTVGPDGETTVERAEQVYPDLRVSGVVTDDLDGARVEELLEESARWMEGGGEYGERLRSLRKNLAEEDEKLHREIIGKVHGRAAYSAACLLMVLSGAVIALHLKDSLPLPVYFLSFFPGLAAILSISVGERMTERVEIFGLVLIWGSVVALGGYTLMMYARLRRH